MAQDRTPRRGLGPSKLEEGVQARGSAAREAAAKILHTFGSADKAVASLAVGATNLREVETLLRSCACGLIEHDINTVLSALTCADGRASLSLSSALRDWVSVWGLCFSKFSCVSSFVYMFCILVHAALQLP